MSFMTNDYVVKRVYTLKDFDDTISRFCFSEADNLSALIGYKFDQEKFNYLAYAQGGLFLICFQRGKPVGILLARLYPSVFDGTTWILMQDILYAKAGSGRAAWILMQSLIAFGRQNADHILTMRTENTNIKKSSLQKLGFKELETVYRLET